GDTVQRHEQQQADCQLDDIVDHGDLAPVRGHERVAAAPEGNAKEGACVQSLPEDRRGRRRHPPLYIAAAHAVEYLHVQQLAQYVGGEAGEGNAENETIEFTQRAHAVEAALVEQDRHDVRGNQRRHHRPRDHAARFGLADQAHSQVGGQENKREAEGTPGAVKAEQVYGQLNQIVAGDDDEDVKRYQQGQVERNPRLRDGYGRHVEPF